VIENEIGGSTKAKVAIFLGLLVSTGGVMAAVHFYWSVCGYRCCPDPNVACINNLRQIDGAKEQWALEKHKGTNDVPSVADISPYILNQEMPKCPVGGIYTLGSAGKGPRCNVAGHVLP
jgi:hypothetical protein